jgi:hypothetical protein
MTGASFKATATHQWFNSRAGGFVRAFYDGRSLYIRKNENTARAMNWIIIIK